MQQSQVRNSGAMRSRSSGRRLAVLAAFVAALPLVSAWAAPSPLATDEQRALDARAVALNQANGFPGLRAEAKAAYQLAHGLPVSQEAQSRLDNAINELAFSAIQKAVNNDPFYPKVYWVDAPPRSWPGVNVPGGRYSFDNPDNIYRTIPIDGASRYVIRGQRRGSGPTDVTFSLISNPNSQQTVAILAGKDLVVNPDGSYAITVDNQPANGRVNHIQSNASAKQLFVRNNLGNWSTEAPDALRVERVGPAPTRGPKGDFPVSSEAWLNLQESIVDYGVGALGVKTYSNPVNTLPAPGSSSTLGTLVTQASSFGHFKLADDEALVATLTTGGAGYFVFPVTDPWSVTVDPIRHQSSLNNRQAITNPDGSYTLVVSRQDPGVANWVDTVGLREGTIMVRWQNLPANRPVNGGPTISAQVVKLVNLASYLPAGTRYVTPAERQQQLAARQAGYQLRVSGGW
jgi:hypothetical protein